MFIVYTFPTGMHLGVQHVLEAWAIYLLNSVQINYEKHLLLTVPILG